MVDAWAGVPRILQTISGYWYIFFAAICCYVMKSNVLCGIN